MNFKRAKNLLEDALDELLKIGSDNVNVQIPLKNIARVIEMIDGEMHATKDWEPSTLYHVGDRVRWIDGKIKRCVIGGISGRVKPVDLTLPFWIDD